MCLSYRVTKDQDQPRSLTPAGLKAWLLLLLPLLKRSLELLAQALLSGAPSPHYCYTWSLRSLGPAA